MGGRGTTSSGGTFDRFAGGNIERKTFNKLPKYAQDSVIAVDSYDPRQYGYNEPINYHMYYIDSSGTVSYLSEDGSDFLGQIRFMGKNEFGKVDDFKIPPNYKYNAGDKFKRKR